MELKNVRRTNAFFLGLILVYLATELFITVLSARDIELSLISSLVLSQGIMLVPALLFIVIFRLDVRTWVPMRRLKASTLGFTLLFTLCISPFVTWINILSQLFTTNIVAELAEELLSSPPLPLLLIIGIIGPFCEELTFRGVIFHGLKFSGRILASILISGLFFGLMHMNLNQLSYAVILGVAFAFLTEATGSILPSFLVHVLVNSSNIGLEFLTDFIYSRFNIEGVDSLTEAIENTEISRNEIFLAAGAYMIPALVGLALSIVVFIAICRREGSLEHIQGLFQSKKERKDLPVLTVTGWIAIGICAVIITAMDLLMKLFSLFVAG
ncbi:MAG: CPBP family intramembrane metalloprotease [Lachnospiraceae bacterium]|nr:CPBP family intramembrane metalloprotease [Lachnospiraceae bacterium]